MTEMGSHRYRELDAMRAIAALGVICWHYVNTYHATPLGHVLAPFYGRGLLMVDFFFVLSGFVLGRAFWTETRAPLFANNIRSRIARLYPLHLCTLMVVAAMQWYLTAHLRRPPFIYANNDCYHLALNLVLLNSSGLEHGFSYNAPSWSISTEFLINILFLGFIATSRKTALWMVWLACAASVATMIVRGVINGTPAFGWISNDLVRTAAGFFVGVLTFRLHRLIGKRAPVAWDVASVALIAICLVYLAARKWANLGDLLVCYIVYPATILSLIRSHFVRAMLCVRPMVYLGEISYSIYLVHFPLLLGIHLWSSVTGIDAPANSSIYLVGFLLAVVVVAGLTYRWIEMPSRRFISSTNWPSGENNVPEAGV